MIVDRKCLMTHGKVDQVVMWVPMLRYRFHISQMKKKSCIYKKNNKENCRFIWKLTNTAYQFKVLDENKFNIL